MGYFAFGWFHPDHPPQYAVAVKENHVRRKRNEPDTVGRRRGVFGHNDRRRGNSPGPRLAAGTNYGDSFVQAVFRSHTAPTERKPPALCTTAAWNRQRLKPRRCLKSAVSNTPT